MTSELDIVGMLEFGEAIVFGKVLEDIFVCTFLALDFRELFVLDMPGATVRMLLSNRYSEDV